MLADIGTNGKPYNYHQTTALNNLYSEDQATVGFITAKVWDKMIDQTLVIVGPNGLRFYNQDGNRGNTYSVVKSNSIHFIIVYLTLRYCVLESVITKNLCYERGRFAAIY